MGIDEIFTKVETLFKEEKHDEIIELIKESLNDYPDNVELYFNLSLAYFVKEEYDESLDILDKLLSIDNGYAMAYYYKSSIALLRQEFETALENIEKAIKYDGGNVDFLNFKGMVLLSLNQADEAISTLESATDVVDNSEILYFNLSKAYSLKNDFPNALKNIDKAISIKPELHNFWAEKSIIEANSNDIISAIKSSKKAWDLNPESKKYEIAYKGLNGLESFLKKDYTGSVKYFQDVVDLEPSIQNLSYLGKAKMQANEYDEALELFNKVLSQDKENVSIILEKANLLKLMGKANESIESYQNFVRVVREKDLKPFFDLANSIDMHYPVSKD